MDQKRIDNLSFSIFPSTCPSPNLVNLHNSAYTLWLEVWTATLQKLKLDPANLPQEFVRQDYIACISHDNLPVALHLYSFYTLESLAARAHPYLRDNYPEIFFAKLARHRVKTVMSMEYMTVHPDWRKKAGEIHLGGVLVGLTSRAMQQFGIDAAIAPARIDHKVHEIAYAWGGEPVIANVINHNVPCDLLMIHRDRVTAHGNAEVQNCLENLWQKLEFHPSPELRANAEIISLANRKKAA